MSLMRPRSATNSVELTPVALSSGIGSETPSSGVVERPAELTGGQAQRDPLGLGHRPGGGDVERGRHVDAAHRRVRQLGLERGGVGPRRARGQVGVGRAGLGHVQAAARAERCAQARGPGAAHVAHRLAEVDLLVGLEHRVAVAAGTGIAERGRFVREHRRRLVVGVRDHQREVLVGRVAVAGHAVAGDLEALDRHGEAVGHARRQVDALHVVARVGLAAAARERAGEHVAQVALATRLDHEIEVVHPGGAGGCARRVGPHERHLHRLAAVLGAVGAQHALARGGRARRRRAGRGTRAPWSRRSSPG